MAQVPCNVFDPLQVFREPFDAVSESNVAIDGVDYSISLFQPLGIGDPPFDLGDFGQLPQSAEMLASQLSGATLTIEGSAFTISGTVTSAVAVPEPSTALLLASGLVAMAAGRKRRAL